MLLRARLHWTDDGLMEAALQFTGYVDSRRQLNQQMLERIRLG